MLINILIIIAISFVILLVILTQTMWLHPKSKLDIVNQKFSEYDDMWVKKEGNKKLFIFLHGMYSRPQPFQEIAEQLVEEGWDIYGPVLPNASTSPYELAEQHSYQWEDSLRVAFHRSLIHNSGYTDVVLCGHSQGGALALSIAPSLPFLKGLIVMSAPLHINPKKAPVWKKIASAFAGVLYYLLPKKGIFLKNSNYKEKSLVEDNQHDKQFIFSLTLHSFNLGLRKTRKVLQNIQTPTLCIHEKGDKVVGYEDAVTISHKIPNCELITMDTPMSVDKYSSRHRIFTYIHTKQQVREEISSFLKKISPL